MSPERVRYTAAMVIVSLFYIATHLLLPTRGLWITDNENKAIQVQALSRSKFSDFSIPWPGRHLDPNLEMSPIRPPFSTVRGNKLYSVFSPGFPALATPLYQAFGPRGLYMLPLLSGILLLAGLRLITRRAEFPDVAGPLALLIAGLCTPLWFYSAVFWEHILAASLAVWSVGFLLEFLEHGNLRRLAASGLACAVAVWFRDQILLFAAVLCLLALIGSRGARLHAALSFGGGLIAGLLPLALFQAAALGDALGFHLTHGFGVGTNQGVASPLLAHLLDRPEAIHNLFLASAGALTPSLFVALPFLILLFANPRLRRDRYVIATLAASLWTLTGVAILAWSYARAESPIAWLLRSNGLYAAAPLLLLAFTRCRDFEEDTPAWRARHHLWRIAALYALLYALITPLRNTTGIHWGNRYLLILYPLLSVLCAANLLDLRRALSGSVRPALSLAPVIVLVVTSFALQIHSIDLLQRKKAWGERLNRTLHERPEKIIISNEWWVPQALAWEFYSREIFLISRRAQLAVLLERLAASGEERFLFVTRAIRRPARHDAIVIDDDGLNYFSLQLVPGQVERARR